MIIVTSLFVTFIKLDGVMQAVRLIGCAAERGIVSGLKQWFATIPSNSLFLTLLKVIPKIAKAVFDMLKQIVVYVFQLPIDAVWDQVPAVSSIKKPKITDLT